MPRGLLRRTPFHITHPLHLQREATIGDGHAQTTRSMFRIQHPRVIALMLPNAHSHVTLPSTIHRVYRVFPALMPHLERLIANGECAAHPPFLMKSTLSALSLRPLIENEVTAPRVMLALKSHRLHLHAILPLLVLSHIGIAHFQFACVV